MRRRCLSRLQQVRRPRVPRTRFAVGGLVGGLAACLLAGSAAAQLGEEWEDRPGLLSEDGDWKSRLGALGIALDLSYTGDFVSNTRGGVARKSTYLGTVDLTAAWDMEALLERELGVLFVYGSWNHGGRPSTFVGDVQATDNIDAPDAIRLFEAWWQQTLLDDRGSLLVGLYDVNSEFYAIDSAELFLNGSFGMGGELGNTGLAGPSTFPVAGLGGRFKVEPVRGLELQVAAVEGAPGDPRRPTATSLDLESDEGAFVIAQLSFDRYASSQDDESDDVVRPLQRRRLGRVWADRPKWVRVAVGSWMYTAKQPHVARVDGLGDPIRSRGHPGLYVTFDYEADHLAIKPGVGMSLFAQLGFADGDVGQFAGYTGGGATFVGLLPGRDDDESGAAIAAAYNGDAFRDAARASGREPAVAEIALEWTYRAVLARWLSIQGDLQYVVNPGGLRDRPDAVVVGLRWVVEL